MLVLTHCSNWPIYNPSARTAQKTALSSQSIGALAAAYRRLSRLFCGNCLATGLYAIISHILVTNQQ
jgi:hypothetical protein